MALGALIIKARLGITDEELIKQIKENPYLQFLINGFLLQLLIGNEAIRRSEERLPSNQPAAA